MREILFRGKEIETGEWIIGSLLSGYLENGRTQILNHDNGDWEDVTPETIGQFTGLTDKNGKKIFEGDVVKGHFYYGFPCERHRLIGIVKFISPTFEVCGVKQYEGERQSLNASYEAIGNVFDNTELFGESHEHH